MPASTLGTVSRSVIRAIATGGVFATLLCVASGDWRWPQAWAFAALSALGVLALGVLVFEVNPALVAERRTASAHAPTWDRLMAAALNLCLPATLVASALDHRFAWSPPQPRAVEALAFVAIALGQALMVWAMRVNAFFSSHVRIQHDRGHTLVDAGPYRAVRHPGYVGALLLNVAAPLALGSGVAIAVAIAFVVLTVARTAREDALLQRELAGYADYARRVRARLLPGIW